MEPEHLTTQIGTSVTILLPSTPGTGATWMPVQIPLNVTIEKRDAVSMAPGIGGPAQQVFVISANAVGDYTLEFVLKRPWESIIRQQRLVLLHVVNAI